ncbi:unnamed protein product [Arabis nemorensis]|uniref:Uncharacterized protein n=1 Tax=Arabis nemorensis TaxID=586526 RepID=A0A565C6U7_9BRAS|nr:unnamed protein product [Arabis nemorensis]
MSMNLQDHKGLTPPMSLNLQDHKGLTPPMSLNLQDHQILTSPMSLDLPDHHQTQSLNPSQFSLFMYNHGDATLSQIPLSAASNFYQSASTQFTNYSAEQESGLKNHLMHQELNGFDQNMCMSDMINSNNFQHPCVSNTQDYLQESVNKYELNQLMQHEMYGYDQNMYTSDITNRNFQHSCLSNTVSDQFCSNFQNPYGNTSFPQDFQDMS